MLIRGVMPLPPPSSTRRLRPPGQREGARSAQRPPASRRHSGCSPGRGDTNPPSDLLHGERAPPSSSRGRARRRVGAPDGLVRRCCGTRWLERTGARGGRALCTTRGGRSRASAASTAMVTSACTTRAPRWSRGARQRRGVRATSPRGRHLSTLAFSEAARAATSGRRCRRRPRRRRRATRRAQELGHLGARAPTYVWSSKPWRAVRAVEHALAGAARRAGLRDRRSASTASACAATTRARASPRTCVLPESARSAPTAPASA
jgi:hypothetical protein